MHLVRLLLIAVVLAGMTSYALADGGLDAKKRKMTGDAMEVIIMRSTLAKNFVGAQKEISESMVQSVCTAVSTESETIMKRDKVKIRYAAIKYRDPKNTATAEEEALLAKFDKDRKLKYQWDEVTIEGKAHLRYSRPIFIEKACLACHGAKDKLPPAISKLYPEDKAYDFEVGDLRGMVQITMEK
ncbi:MAG: DUF3365 domain-containing protein [Nitrospirota bacterium]|nr:DUF3365 domain-containing protein [Nitrospirota bacterium]